MEDMGKDSELTEGQPKADVTAPLARFSGSKLVAAILGAAIIIGALVWQAVVVAGAPDPTTKGLSRSSMLMGSGILVFREGLEAILVLAAVTAGLARYKKGFWSPMLTGIGAALATTVATWFVAIALISSVNASELEIQAGTGLLAIAVLLVVMNWFFHKLYWTGWICSHCKRRKKIFEVPIAPASRVYFGLALLGFTAVYREGFEVVLFLQDLRLKRRNQRGSSEADGQEEEPVKEESYRTVEPEPSRVPAYSRDVTAYPREAS